MKMRLFAGVIAMVMSGCTQTNAVDADNAPIRATIGEVLPVVDALLLSTDVIGVLQQASVAMRIEQIPQPTDKYLIVEFPEPQDLRVGGQLIAEMQRVELHIGARSRENLALRIYVTTASGEQWSIAKYLRGAYSLIRFIDGQ